MDPSYGPRVKHFIAAVEALAVLMWSAALAATVLLVWPAGRMGPRNCARPARGSAGLAVATLSVLVAAGQVWSAQAQSGKKSCSGFAQGQDTFMNDCNYGGCKKGSCSALDRTGYCRATCKDNPQSPEICEDKSGWYWCTDGKTETQENIEKIEENHAEAMKKTGMTNIDWVFVGLSIAMELQTNIHLQQNHETFTLFELDVHVGWLLIIEVAFSVGKIFPPYTTGIPSSFLNCQSGLTVEMFIFPVACERVTHICVMTMASWWFAILEWRVLCEVYKKNGSGNSSVFTAIAKVIQYFVSLVFILYEAGKYPGLNASTKVIIAFASLAEISLILLEGYAFFKYSDASGQFNITKLFRKQNAVQDIGMVESGLASTAAVGVVISTVIVPN
jgi:hypothetical protein